MKNTIKGKYEDIKGSEYVWVCDPIDGTIPYSLGVPISTFSLALVKNGEVIPAMVFNGEIMETKQRIKEEDIESLSFIEGLALDIAKAEW